jgi:CRP-like cAMP-binding protein
MRSAEPPANLLFEAMPKEVRNRLLPKCKRVHLSRNEILCDAGARPGHVVFPRTCVLSLLSVAETGDGVETAALGREAAFGLLAGLQEHPSSSRCLVQLAGSVDRVPVHEFKKEFNRSERLRAVALSCVEAILAQAQLSVLCNALHSVKQRLCRWLLMLHDRAGSDALPLTQEFLAAMLPANRGSVTTAARELQAAGRIRYARGIIRITDRPRLEADACECYGAIRRHLELLWP